MHVKTNSDGRVVKQRADGTTVDNPSEWEQFQDIPLKSADDAFLFVVNGELTWKTPEDLQRETGDVAGLRESLIEQVNKSRRQFSSSSIQVLGDEFEAGIEEVREITNYYLLFLESQEGEGGGPPPFAGPNKGSGSSGDNPLEEMGTFPATMASSDLAGNESGFVVDLQLADGTYRRVNEDELVTILDALAERELVARKRARSIIQELQDATTVSELNSVDLSIE